ncbi:hypothetical protein QFZ49_007047 [Streptomyces turgidiscabies]|uniref:STAS domain-containing protein n=1 Tax=Streptomyces turgidiscabies TaxID=85558 RepID=A0ABU0RYM3_9ACTN|nr:hypothetical protein [Streptomyces turgidiscabies]
MDATGALMLKDAVRKLNRRGIVVMCSGIRPGQHQVLDSVGLLELLRAEGHEYVTTPEAIRGARSPGDRRRPVRRTRPEGPGHGHRRGGFPVSTRAAVISPAATWARMSVMVFMNGWMRGAGYRPVGPYSSLREATAR